MEKEKRLQSATTSSERDGGVARYSVKIQLGQSDMASRGILAKMDGPHAHWWNQGRDRS